MVVESIKKFLAQYLKYLAPVGIVAATLLVDERQKNSILKFEPYAHE